jgi:DtxR family transcriptional regulator, Mn-dependent transcriptional regulator
MLPKSHSIQDYLKAIYKIGSDSPVLTNDIARFLGVKAPSVSNMVKKLSAMHLVEYNSHHGVVLTESGRKIALEVLRHHRLLETYLKVALGYPLERLHEEAEKLEHVISEEFEDRIDAIMGHPQFDPHGDPIPSKEGVMPHFEDVPLSSIAANTPFMLSRISAKDKNNLRFFETNQLLPGQIVTVESTNSLTLSIKLSSQQLLLDRQLAELLHGSIIS